MSDDPPRVLICEDGTEYADRFARFLPDGFRFAHARSLAEVEAQADAVRVLVLDLDFRRTAAEALVDESGRAAPERDAATVRRLAAEQGIYILRALRARGFGRPALLFADLDDPERVAFLERELGPLVVVASTRSLPEVEGLLRAAVRQAPEAPKGGATA